MGFIKDSKAAAIGAEARKAIEAGHTVFTPRLNMPGSQPGLTGNIDTWAIMIGQIEAEGWVLQDWSVAMDTKGRTEAYPLFRRA